MRAGCCRSSAGAAASPAARWARSGSARNETMFEIAGGAARDFALAASEPNPRARHVVITRADGPSRTRGPTAPVRAPARSRVTRPSLTRGPAPAVAPAAARGARGASATARAGAAAATSATARAGPRAAASGPRPHQPRARRSRRGRTSHRAGRSRRGRTSHRARRSQRGRTGTCRPDIARSSAGCLAKMRPSSRDRTSRRARRSPRGRTSRRARRSPRERIWGLSPSPAPGASPECARAAAASRAFAIAHQPSRQHERPRPHQPGKAYGHPQSQAPGKSHGHPRPHARRRSPASIAARAERALPRRHPGRPQEWGDRPSVAIPDAAAFHGANPTGGLGNKGPLILQGAAPVGERRAETSASHERDNAYEAPANSRRFSRSSRLCRPHILRGGHGWRHGHRRNHR